ncbi:hypothetical protein [Meiothermus sp.]|uniref:hypothetical protein n=1 Tax=Meiothermus sp. TaxID=1955249 RepID=UPI002637BF11|nr:hypothetical protein [Meiothermus sp.]
MFSDLERCEIGVYPLLSLAPNLLLERGLRWETLLWVGLGLTAFAANVPGFPGSF